MYGGVQAIRVHALHQLEPLGRRVGDRRPPNGAGVVHDAVQTTGEADGLRHHVLDLRDIAHVDLDAEGCAAGVGDLAGDGVDGRLGGVGVRREGDGVLGVGGGFCGDDDCGLLDG